MLTVSVSGYVRDKSQSGGAPSPRLKERITDQSLVAGFLADDEEMMPES